MIKKFVNNEMSDSDVNSMMEEFFVKKDEVEFKSRWHDIVDEHYSSKPPHVVKFFRRYFYSTISAASIILVLGFSTFVISDSVFIRSIKYTVLSKGNKKNIETLNFNIKTYNASIEDNSSNTKGNIINLYQTSRYKKVINEVNDLIRSNENVSDKKLLLASFSSIKRYDFKKAKYYLSMINSDSPFYLKSKEMLTIVQKILD